MNIKYFAIVEIQINDGVPSSPPVIFVNNREQAVGEMFSKLGYAYQNPRDYTAVAILDEQGHNITSEFQIANTLDNRDVKTPVYSLIEIQINDDQVVASPVNVQIGDEAQSIIMQAYHNVLSYAWNVKRPFTEAVVVGQNGRNFCKECVDFMPAEEEPTPTPMEGT